MKTFLLAVLLSASLSAEMYECKNSFLRIESNRIVETFKDGESRHATRSYGAFCYDFYDGDKKVYLCLEQNGNTFTWSSSEGKRTEKCVRVYRSLPASCRSVNYNDLSTLKLSFSINKCFSYLFFC